MAKQRFSKISTLMNAIFGNSTPDPSVPGDEMSENDMIAQRTNDKKLSKGALKSLIKTADSLANKEKPEIIEAVKVQMGANPYDLSSVKQQRMDSANSPLFASLNDIQSNNYKTMGENQGSLMKALYGNNLPQTVNRR
jgi:hypothetical protein|tara:strand:- start:4298 stop:4711 length:414 start_codon:yes stop_codon:yes gene_type:complete